MSLDEGAISAESHELWVAVQALTAGGARYRENLAEAWAMA